MRYAPVPPESETRQRVREMRAAGLTPRQISLALAISTQAVYQHLKKIAKADLRESA